MIIQLFVATFWLSLIIALRYLVLAYLAYWVLWGKGTVLTARLQRLSRRNPQPQIVRHEVVSSLISSPIYALPAAAVLVAFQHGYTKLYVDVNSHGLWWLPVSAMIYLFAHDAFYYWLHRALHLRGVFAWSHRGHHRSIDPSPFASFSFDPAEAALTAWFLPALTLFIPLQVGVALGLLMLMTATAVMNHAGWEVWPERWLQSRVGGWIITARHHNLHHQRFTNNYGLYFRLWDRIAGTDRDEGD